eukprot:scaffold124572_cov27-Tisochrysis_lutea.AAC.2
MAAVKGASFLGANCAAKLDAPLAEPSFRVAELTNTAELAPSTNSLGGTSRRIDRAGVPRHTCELEDAPKMGRRSEASASRRAERVESAFRRSK